MSVSAVGDPIPEVPPRILEAARNGRLVAFVGAGVSRLAGCPSWSEFAIQTLDYIFEQGVVTFEQRESLSRYGARQALTMALGLLEQHHRGRDEILGGFRSQTRTTSAHSAIRSLGSACITTNYDLLLENALPPSPTEPERQASTQAGRPDSDYLQDHFFEERLRPDRVMHIHGAIIDAGATVISVPDYRSQYASSANLPNLLGRVFRGPYCVVFIGYGLEEEEILESLWRLRQAGADHSSLQTQHAILYPLRPEEECVQDSLRSYYGALGVEFLPYRIGRQGYVRLEEVLGAWSREIGPAARPRLSIETLGLIDRVTS